MKLRGLFLFAAIIAIYVLINRLDTLVLNEVQGDAAAAGGGATNSQAMQPPVIRFKADTQPPGEQPELAVEDEAQQEEAVELEDNENKDDAQTAPGRGMRVDTHYQNTDEVITALLNRGATLLLADASYRVVGKVGSDRQIYRVAPIDLNGVTRQATAEVVRYLKQPLPDGAIHGLVVWPEPLWERLLANIPAEVDYVRITLSLTGVQLIARVQPMPSDQYELITRSL